MPSTTGLEIATFDQDFERVDFLDRGCYTLKINRESDCGLMCAKDRKG